MNCNTKFSGNPAACVVGEKVPCYNKKIRLARAQCSRAASQSGCIASIIRGSRNGPQTAGAEAYSMITREQIRKLAGYSYSRGVDIWRQGKIRRFQIKTTKKGRQIQADVKGSGRNLYDVRILLDEEEDSVQDWSSSASEHRQEACYRFWRVCASIVRLCFCIIWKIRTGWKKSI